eukprot:2672744-Alexandrium_andersonii.AAC.1
MSPASATMTDTGAGPGRGPEGNPTKLTALAALGNSGDGGPTQGRHCSADRLPATSAFMSTGGASKQPS